MRNVSGDDLVALTEIVAAMERASADPTGRAHVMRLAIYRDFLIERNTHLRLGLPIIDTADFDSGYASEAAGGSIADVNRRGLAMMLLAGAFAEFGELDRRAMFLSQAVDTVQSMTDSDKRPRALAVLAGVLAQSGELDRAEQLIDAALAEARSVADAHQRMQSLTVLAAVLAQHGDQARAMELLSEAEAATNP